MPDDPRTADSRRAVDGRVPASPSDPAPSPVPTNLDLLRLFRRCAHAQRSGGGPHGQGRVLVTLAARGPMAQRELADACERTPATLSQQLDAMEQAGLVVRGKSPGDRRRVDVALTDAGREAAREAAERRRRLADALFGPLGDRDRADLARLLAALLDRWSALDFAGYAADPPSVAPAAGTGPAACGKGDAR